MNKEAWLAWAITNSLCIISWVALAMVFDKWYIAIFGLLFVSELKISSKIYYRVCDICGEHSPYAESTQNALKKAKSASWIHNKESNSDYCPKCQQHMKGKYEA